MKKLIFVCAFLLLAATAIRGQETAPPDTGRGQTPLQPAVPSAPADSPTVITPAQPSAPPADTSGAVPQAADTGSAAPPPSGAPADTGAVASPSDTAAAVSPPTTPPADTAAAAPLPVTPPIQTPAPETTAAAPAEEEEITRESRPPNRFALGLIFNDEAPLAVRTWFNPKVGLDIGLGINVREVEDQTATVLSPDSTTAFLDLSFDLGVPVRVLHKEKVDFIVRPGFGFRTRPAFEELVGIVSVETGLELEFNGTFGIEYYPFEKASFGLFTGIAVVQTRPGGTGNTTLRVESLPKKAANFTFRYYLF